MGSVAAGNFDIHLEYPILILRKNLFGSQLTIFIII